jgi:hypothetical protein
MYSKDVGDFDVRVKEEKYEEFTWNSVYGQKARTFERGFQTDLVDTKRHVGYLDRELKVVDEDNVEEQRQEIITFRLPLERRITEEIYETTITTETKQKNQQIEEIRSRNKSDDYIKSETKEWTRPFTDKKRLKSPEELVEESYEVVSTLKKPRDGDFLIASTGPRSTIIQKSSDASATKLQSSEDDSSYCEEWTVTEAKRKQDGQTVKTIIDR